MAPFLLQRFLAAHNVISAFFLTLSGIFFRVATSGKKWFFGGKMFEGAEPLNLDAKGRLLVPARQREALQAVSGGELVLTAHPHGCLLLYPRPDWEPIRARILATPSFEVRSAALKRVLVGNARAESLDAAGRLLVAPGLREYAGLEKAAWFVGMGSHFEIWSDAGWKAQAGVALEALRDGMPPAGFEDFAL